MVAKIRGDGTGARATAGEIHPALPKLRDQLQSRRRHGEALHREPRRQRSREKVERVRKVAFFTASSERINHEWTRIGINDQDSERAIGDDSSYLRVFVFIS